jgi:general stress protein CsbA
MTRMPFPKTQQQKEYVAELLKERIYATLALLAVLISIDSTHTTPLHAAYIICGTIVSLWAASIVATQMSRRVIFQGELDHSQEVHHHIRRHAPILASLVFPLMMIWLAMLHLISLAAAINVSIISALALLAGWSIGSARSLRTKKLPTLVLVVIELAIGLSIVGLKLLVEH